MSDDITLDEFTKQEEGTERKSVRWGSKTETIPIDWEFNSIDNYATEIVYPQRDKPTRFDGEIPWVRIEDLDGMYISEPDDDERYVSRELMDEMNLRSFPEGTLMCSCSTTMGVCAITTRELLSNQTFAGIVTDDNINTQYLYYAISDCAEELEQLATGSTISYLSSDKLEQFHIPAPPLSEQRKIATVLHTVDQAIQKTEEIIEQADLLKKGAKDKIISEGLENNDTKRVRLGSVSTKIPTYWERERIGELLLDSQLGTSERGSDDNGENISLIKMGNLDFGTWDLSEVETIQKDSQMLEELGLQRGDLLFNTRNTPELVGKTAVWDFDCEAVYDNNLLRLRFGDRISSGHFVNIYLSSNIGRRQLRGRVHGITSVAAIYSADLQQVEIPVPPKDEQESIVKKIRAIDEVRTHNQSYRKVLRRIKKGLMQDLLSGEVRTTDTNVHIPEEVVKYG